MAEFYRIKNWETYQSLSRSGTWIKDYTNQEDDEDYCDLTVFQRGILQELRRLRGRLGRNLPTNVQWLVNSMSLKPQDRINAGSAIRQLLALGWLVLTDQKLNVDNSSEKESKKEKENKNREEKKEPSSVAASAPQEPIKVVMLLPLNHGEFAVSEEDFTLWKGLYPAVDVLQELRAMAGWCHANVKKRKTKEGVKRFINSWLAKAQNNPKAATEFRNGQPKSEQRQQRNDDKYARIEQRISGLPAVPGASVQVGTSGSGNRDVDSRPKLLSAGRSAGSG